MSVVETLGMDFDDNSGIFSVLIFVKYDVGQIKGVYGSNHGPGTPQKFTDDDVGRGLLFRRQLSISKSPIES